MKILAIDASSGVATVSLISDDILVGEYTINHKKTHSQTLMPMISQLLETVETTIEEVDAFAVSVGPGSFTGLRIGLATIKGLAHACNKPIVGVSTLEAMAYNIAFCSDLIVPILDARRDQVYTAIYLWEYGKLITHTEPCVVSIDYLLGILKKENKKAVFLGDGVARFKEQILNGLGEYAEFACANLCLQKASSVAVCAKQKLSDKTAMFGYNEIAPIYLRKSQAEREYDEREKK